MNTRTIKIKELIPYLTQQGVSSYTIPTNEIWKFDGELLEEGVDLLEANQEEPEGLVFYTINGEAWCYDTDFNLSIERLQRYRLTPISFPEQEQPKCFSVPIPVTNEVSEPDMWKWAEQQEIVTLENIWYDEHKQSVFVIPHFDHDKTTEIGQDLTNDFYKYFSNIKP